MSFTLKYKDEILYRNKGNYKNIKSCFLFFPKDIRAKIIENDLEDFVIINSDEPFVKSNLKDVHPVETPKSSRSQRNKKYYEKITKQNKIQCECGATVLKVSYKTHLKSKKHLNRCGFESCEDE